MSDESSTSRLAQIEAKRAARKAQIDDARNEQRATDLEAIDAIEAERGDSNVVMLEVPYSPGMVTLVAARCPSEAEVKRYRAMVKPDRQGRAGDAVAAAELLASVTRVYPDEDAYAVVRAARPAIHAQLGAMALTLAIGKAEEEGKD